MSKIQIQRFKDSKILKCHISKCKCENLLQTRPGCTLLSDWDHSGPQTRVPFCFSFFSSEPSFVPLFRALFFPCSCLFLDFFRSRGRRDDAQKGAAPRGPRHAPRTVPTETFEQDVERAFARAGGGSLSLSLSQRPFDPFEFRRTFQRRGPTTEGQLATDVQRNWRRNSNGLFTRRRSSRTRRKRARLPRGRSRPLKRPLKWWFESPFHVSNAVSNSFKLSTSMGVCGVMVSRETQRRDTFLCFC